MRLTIEEGKRSAKQIAINDTALYQRAVQKFGLTIEPYKGQAPPALGVSHVLRVNRKLEIAPTPTRDRRRGFMLATINMANAAGVAWSKLDEPTTCSYVWGRDINEDGKNLYMAQNAFFPSPNADFWKCTYLKHTLGDAAFDLLWNSRNTEEDTVYDSLLYVVNNLTRSLPGWPVVTLRKTVLVDCEYVYEMVARGGGFATEGYGLQPVLTQVDHQQVFN